MPADAQLSRRELEASAGELHRSMEAWHQLGTAQQVATLFGELYAILEALRSGNQGWKSKLRSFLGFESRRAEAVADIGRKLSALHTNAQIFGQRLRQLGQAHEESLNGYQSVLLNSASNDSDTGQADISQCSFQASGLELVAAQQQLAQMAKFQLDAVLRLSVEMEQVISMSAALTANFEATKRMLAERFGPAFGVLQRNSARP